MTRRWNNFWIQTHLLSPRLGVYLILLTPLLVWDTLFFGYASTKIFWVYAVVEMTFVASVWFTWHHPEWRYKYPWTAWIFFGFLLVLVISTVTGVYPANSFWGSDARNASLLTWGHLALLFLVLRSFFRTTKDWQVLACMSVCVGLLVSLVFFLARVDLSQFTILDNGGSTLGNSSYLGTYLLFQIFFAVFLVIQTKDKWTRSLGIVAFLVFILTLFSTDARAAMGAFLGAVVFALGLFLLTRRATFKRVFGGLLVGGLLLFFGYIAIFAYVPQSTLHQWVIEQATASRFVVADMAIEAFKERPLLGWGPENFSYAFLAHYNPCFGDALCGGNTLFDRAHNVILDMLVQTGLLGLIGYLSVLATAVVSAWLAVKRHVLDLKVGIVFTATLAAYVVQNLTFLDELNSLVFLVILFSFPSALLSKPSARHTPASIPLVPALITILLPVTFFLFVIQPVRGGLAVFSATGATNSNERYAALEVALEASPFGRDTRTEYLGFTTAKWVWSFRPEQDAYTLGRQSAYIQQEVALLETALYETIKTSPNSFRSYLYLVQLLQAHARLFDKEKFTEAMDVIDEAIARNPRFPRLYWVKVSLLLEQGERAMARDVAQTALALNTDLGRSWWNTFLVATYINDTSLQENASAQLESRYPSFVVAMQDILSRNLEEDALALLYALYAE